MTHPALADFAALAEMRLKKRNPWAGMKFTAFCRNKLKVTLRPGQMALALVAYDGIEPQDLPTEYRYKGERGEEKVYNLRELGRRIFGPIDVLPEGVRRVFVLVAGGRGGKTFLGALRCLHLALTVDISSLQPGERAFGSVISSDPRQRKQCFGFIHGAAMNCPEINAMMRGRALSPDFTGSEFDLHRKDGVVTIESIPPKSEGGSGRGRWFVCALMEEAAFFKNENYKVNDKDVFRAVTPRLLPGAQCIVSSTPWAEIGILFELFVGNHPAPQCAAPHLTKPGVPHNALAAHAPTLLLSDTEMNRGIVAAEQDSDADNAAREYGAQFLSSGTSMFLDAAKIAACVALNPRLALGTGRMTDVIRPGFHPQWIAATGFDLGLTSDAAARVDVERGPDRYRLLNFDEIFAVREGLAPSKVYERLVQGAVNAGIEEMIGDHHHIEEAREAFTGKDRAVLVIPGGQNGKAEVYNALRTVIHEVQIELPDVERLLTQLKSVTKRPIPGGGFAIEMPRTKKGGHCDIVPALAAAVWHLKRQVIPDAPPEYREATIDERAAAWQQRVEDRIAEEAESDGDEFDPYKQNGWMLG